MFGLFLILPFYYTWHLGLWQQHMTQNVREKKENNEKNHIYTDDDFSVCVCVHFIL